MGTTRDELKDRCDAIEESHEFMLAYAAQGLAGDEANASSGQLRVFLTRCDEALTSLAELFGRLVEGEDLEPAARYRAFTAVFDRDARDAQAAVQLVLTQPSISSQLIDNLNASIHVRALLTDLFLIDEIIKPQAEMKPATSS